MSSSNGSRRSRTTLAAALVAAAAATSLLAGCASAGTAGTAQSSGGAGTPVKVGLLYSKTGLLAAYGQQYEQGFKAGLAYATHNTDKVNGHQIQVTEEDDTGDPATAVADAKDLIGKGYKILAGTVDSGIGLQLAPLAAQNQVLYIAGPAATDALTGVNKYTFRSGRESYQDIAAAGSFVGDPSGKKILVLAQDDAFGQDNVQAVQAVLGPKGAHVSSVLAPPSATDLTPFAQQVKTAKADLVYVAWAGSTAPALWTALDQQGVLGSTKVVTGLAGDASYPIFGASGTKVDFLAHYFPGAGGGNPVETAMINGIKAEGGTPDLFSPDGFTAALMIVHAIQASTTDTNAMVSALEGWSFAGPKGQEQVRASDHALLQPMFQATLTGTGASAQPKLLATLPAGQVAPPAKTMAG
ncbi:substrate-binding domain-containing protein [Streptacidiphilus fuscans]|uniref:Substrate-binding domain-containing protein n=1 Tax=Streptacidiphilus fuscans TaxID=2789292 RepID=A0A931FJ43_9ACTN|nr:substrate-binding domain-containing protein [Streptacidiphilus fuscans]MBF9072394.1 substrate-binding domain-containing protein [Streptacidiphilus fuscans]